MKLFFLSLLFCTSSLAERIAVSSDGNKHDRDDICASAVSVALISKAGRSGDLVYWGYCDHFWRTNSSWEPLMRDSVEGTVARYGGFSLGIYYNTRANFLPSRTALVNEINKSTADNPLVILMAGPAQVVGRAIYLSNPSARPFVTVMSHSDWNDTHAYQYGKSEGLNAPAYYQFSDFAPMGVNTVHIQNQNPGTNRPYVEYYWMRDSADSNLQWLWQRGQVANKSTYDCSDAGLTYFMLTGDQDATPEKLRSLLER